MLLTRGMNCRRIEQQCCRSSCLPRNLTLVTAGDYALGMRKVRVSNARDGERVVQIWSDAVDATHGFLSPEDRKIIGEEVKAFLPFAPLFLAVDETENAVGFMALTSNHIDALFVDPKWHRTGVGRQLIDHARTLHSRLTVDVNEQNKEALGFYDHLGFVRSGRSPNDDQGRPYPLIHLQLQKPF